MPKQNNAHDKKTEIQKGLNSIAERYLDLWQDNIRLWARNPDNSDPNAPDKWAAEAAQYKKRSDENTS